MENKVLEKNLAHINQYSKQLSDKILMTNIEKSNLQITNTESGEYNLIFNDVELHSNINPQKEVQDIAGNFENKENIIIIYGLGLGYLPDLISQKCEKSKIIIYEPNLDLLKFVLSIAEIDALYKNNVFLSSNIDELSLILKNITTANAGLSICFLDSYKKMFYNDILKVFDSAKNILSEIIGNRNTYIAQMPTATANSLYNTGKIIMSPQIEQLKGIYKNKTAVLLCAGPSLEENIKIIKSNQNKFVTFALSPTLKLLKKYEITPDFIVNIDSVNNTKQFDGIDVSNSCLITEAYSCCNITNLKYKNTFFYISKNNFFNYWLRKNLNIQNNLETLGTSSYTALSSALLMGFSKIILVGQDLAFKDGKCYSKGSQYDCLECVYNNEKQKYEIIAPNFSDFIKAFKTKNEYEPDLEQKAGEYINILNNNLRTTMDKNGNPIPTKADYLTFIKLFENLSENVKDVELINSSNGANIKGFKNIELKEAFKGLEDIDKLNLDSYKANYKLEILKNEIKILKTNLTNTNKNLENYLNSANKLLKEIKIKKTYTDNVLKLIQKYKIDFDNLIENFKNEDINTVLAFFAQDIYNLLNTDYCLNINTLENTLEKIMPVFEKMKFFANIYINCINQANIR